MLSTKLMILATLAVSLGNVIPLNCGQSGAPATTPFGQLIAMPPAPPTGQPPGVAAAATEALLRQLVAS